MGALNFTIVPVAPIRTDRVFAHVNRGAQGSGFEWIDSPVYPLHERGDELRGIRVRAALSLRQAADVLGLEPVDVSGLEHGRAKLASDDEWSRAIEAVYAAGQAATEARRKGGGQ